MKTAKEYYHSHTYSDHPSELMIGFTKAHFDKAIEKLETDRDRIKKQLNDIDDLVHQAVMLGIIETYNKSIQLLKEYKKEKIK